MKEAFGQREIGLLPKVENALTKVENALTKVKEPLTKFANQSFFFKVFTRDVAAKG